MPEPPKAVVSGLGPNGITAALTLLDCGFHVTAVEQRPDYTRPIHLRLRDSYLDDLAQLDKDLREKLQPLMAPIETESRVRLSPSFSEHYEPAIPTTDVGVRKRLAKNVSFHVRLDELEDLYFRHLESLKEGLPLVIYRGFAVTIETDGPRFRASVGPSKYAPRDSAETVDLGTPDLVVLTEGGKSPTARTLGMEMRVFSPPKYYLSGHVEQPFGSQTRRIDTTVEAPFSPTDHASTIPVPVSMWATGHADTGKGVWVVIEVPPTMRLDSREDALEYFAWGAALLLEDSPTGQPGSALVEKARASTGMDFFGTYRFEQQLLTHPAAGENVIALGDAAGMGHHDCSSGLELGITDLDHLRALAQNIAQDVNRTDAVEAYARNVYRSRIELLAHGMQEYYPSPSATSPSLIAAAARVSGSSGAKRPRDVLEAMLPSTTAATPAPKPPSEDREDGAEILEKLLSDGTRKTDSPIAWMWDVDDTLVFTRPRMLATVQAFGCFEATLDDVKHSWQATADALGLERQRFFEFWYEYYWDPENFTFDQPIEATLRFARRAQELGIANMVVSGRTREYRDVTRRQLERCGIEATRIFHKPDDEPGTARLKVGTALALKGMGYHLAAFVTDSVTEIQAMREPAVRDAATELQCVYCFVPPHDRDLSRLAPEVPILRVEV